MKKVWIIDCFPFSICLFTFSTNFGLSGNVSIGGVPCLLTGPGYSQSIIQCLVPSGIDSSKQLIVYAKDQQSNSIAFSYNPPIVNLLQPTHGATEGGYNLTVTG